jgi:hypothetical protein
MSFSARLPHGDGRGLWQTGPPCDGAGGGRAEVPGRWLAPRSRSPSLECTSREGLRPGAARAADPLWRHWCVFLAHVGSDHVRSRYTKEQAEATGTKRPGGGGAVDQRAAIGLRDVWAVIEASAERRLGKPLLKAYLLLAIFGIVVVVVCVVIMHCGG